MSVDAVCCGPLERTRGTAGPVAADHGLPLQSCIRLHEVDYGEWTGRRISELGAEPDWRRWNECRGSARVPAGESMAEVQTRAVAELQAFQRQRPDGTVVVVSHGDVIRALLAHHLGMPLDECLRLEVAPGSVSLVTTRDATSRVPFVNATADPAEPTTRPALHEVLAAAGLLSGSGTERAGTR